MNPANFAFVAAMLVAVGCGGGNGDGVVAPGPSFQAGPEPTAGFFVRARFEGRDVLLDLWERRAFNGAPPTAVRFGFRLPAGLAPVEVTSGAGWELQLGESPDVALGVDGTGLLIASVERIPTRNLCETGCTTTNQGPGDRRLLTLRATAAGAGAYPVALETVDGWEVALCDAGCGVTGPYLGGVISGDVVDPPAGGTVVIP